MITLTTDFGYKDHYVGAMKGVILSMIPNAAIVDITHGVMRHDIRHAAYIVQSIIDYFPNAVHIVVVDPGVGTARRGIVAKLDNGYYVGPDNGILTLVEKRVKKVWEIKISPKSNTFHGRDVFAPAGALVELGDFSKFVPVGDFLKFEIRRAKIDGNRLSGEVIHIDHFGNVITNIPSSMISGISCLSFHGRNLKIAASYGEMKRGEMLALVNSENYLEIAVNQGSAEKVTGLKVGDKVVFEIC